jgi:hypothetical protein
MVSTQAPGLTVSHLVFSQPVAGWAVPCPTLAQEREQKVSVRRKTPPLPVNARVGDAFRGITEYVQDRGDWFDLREGSACSGFCTWSLPTLPPPHKYQTRVEAWPQAADRPSLRPGLEMYVALKARGAVGDCQLAGEPELKS